MPTRRFLLPLVFSAVTMVFVFTGAPQARSQGAGPSDESFETVDGVKLNGRFYKATVNKNGSCVLLMPGFKKDPTKGDWDGLARRLSGEGYNVLLIHYRGHGRSTDMNGKEFFGNPILGPINTKYVPGANRNPPRNTLQANEFRTGYGSMLVNDIMAARSFLERKNDNGEVNVSTMYLIGAGDACPLGLFYIAAEWHREAERPAIEFTRRPYIDGRLRVNGAAAGKDIAACIWLTAERTPALNDGTVKQFISAYAPDMRQETRMLFLHGDGDSRGASQSKYFFDEVLVARGKQGRVEKMELTEIRSIKNCKLGGVDLLGKNDTFGTEDTISKYLQAVEDDRKGKARFARQYTAPLPVAIQTFGINP